MAVATSALQIRPANFDRTPEKRIRRPDRSMAARAAQGLGGESARPRPLAARRFPQPNCNRKQVERAPLWKTQLAILSLGCVDVSGLAGGREALSEVKCEWPALTPALSPGAEHVPHFFRWTP